MDRDTSLSVQIEVTVPHIVLPALTQETKQTGVEPIKEGMEQVRLFPIEMPHPRQTLSPREGHIVVEDASTYTTRSGLFNLFQFTATLVQKQPYLLQVLRRWKEQRQGQGQQSPGGNVGFRVTNEQAFLLEYRSINDDISMTQPLELTPGLHHVVVTLDAEGTPVTYSIDGVDE